MKQETPLVGRFAPTPSGRMPVGNVFAAMLAWLSVRSRGGSLVLRMEDLDTQRTSAEFAEVLRRDLLWLGLDWDVETQAQSMRGPVYDRYFQQLADRLKAVQNRIIHARAVIIQANTAKTFGVDHIGELDGFAGKGAELCRKALRLIVRQGNGAHCLYRKNTVILIIKIATESENLLSF